MNFNPKKHLGDGVPRRIRDRQLRQQRALDAHRAKVAAFVGPPAPLWHVYRDLPPGQITVAGGTSLTQALREKGFTSFMGVPIAPLPARPASPDPAADPAPPAPPQAAP